MGKMDKSHIAPLDTLGCLTLGEPDKGLLATGLSLNDGHNNDHKNKDEEWAEADGLESPLVHFVTPQFKFLRLIFMTHSRFEYDEKERIFLNRPGSVLRKAICWILQSFVILLILGEGRMVQDSLGEKSVVGLYKIMGLSYIGLSASFQIGVMCKGDQVRDILNFIQAMTCCISKTGCKIPRKRIIKPLATGMLLLYIVEAVLYTLVNVDGTHAMSLKNGTSGFFQIGADQCARKFLAIFNPENSSELIRYKFSEQWKDNPPLIYALGTAHLFIHLRLSFSWVMAYLLLTMWGLLFWKVLHIFFAVIYGCSSRNTLEDIRQFNTITGIIDQFNRAFGWTVLTALVAGVLHFSVNIVDLFQASQVWTQKCIVVAGLITLGLMLLATAQVNQAAANIMEVLKTRFQERRVWAEIHGQCTETTQGMMIVLHEIQCSKIGFRGLGFFTITYSFIGTVLSLISTYSIVVMQLQSS